MHGRRRVFDWGCSACARRLDSPSIPPSLLALFTPPPLCQDGETKAYDSDSAVATSDLAWDDASGCLSWAKGGANPNPAGARAFTQVAVTLLTQQGTKKAGAVDFTVSGKACPV